MYSIYTWPPMCMDEDEVMYVLSQSANQSKPPKTVGGTLLHKKNTSFRHLQSTIARGPINSVERTNSLNACNCRAVCAVQAVEAQDDFKRIFKLQPKKFQNFIQNQSATSVTISWLSQIAIKKEDKLPTMTVEFIIVGSLIVMSIVTFCVIKIYLVVLSMQSRPVHLAVMIPVQWRTDNQRALMIITRVGNRPVPQENDEWLCWQSKRAQYIWFSFY